jgi:hypothetical protein
VLVSASQCAVADHDHPALSRALGSPPGGHARIRYLLLNAYGAGGTIRTTLSMAGVLAARGHDVDVAGVTQRRPCPCFPVPPGAAGLPDESVSGP